MSPEEHECNESDVGISLIELRIKNKQIATSSF